MNGTKMSIRVGDPDILEEERYWRVKKDKSSALNAQSNDDDQNTKSKKRFYIYADQMAGNCLNDGDVIRLKNKSYGRWVSSVNGSLIAKSNGGYDYQAFTVIFDPFADE